MPKNKFTFHVILAVTLLLFIGNAFSQNYFLENKGQLVDQNGKPRNEILFYSHFNGFSLFITKDGFEYQLQKSNVTGSSYTIKSLDLEKPIDTIETNYHRIKVEFLNTNDEADAIGLSPKQYYQNFYLDHCPNGIEKIKSYQIIEIRDLYQGIDLRFYFKDGFLKYDFVVKPNASLDVLRWTYHGVDNPFVTQQGNIELITSLGSIAEEAPISFQKNKAINTRFVQDGNMFSFGIGNFNRNDTLVIDPLIRIWGTYFGGTNDETEGYITVDDSGYVFMAGITFSVDNIATSGAFQDTMIGTGGAFITKFDANGNQIWGTYYYGAAGGIYVKCITEKNDYLYIPGWTTMLTVIGTPGTHQPSLSPGGQFDGFVAKFKKDGTRVWGTYYGGNAADGANFCSVDSIGNVYLCGFTGGTGIATAGAHQTTISGMQDGFIAKLDSNGVRLWGTYYGGTQLDEFKDMKIGNDGNIIISGRTASLNNISTIGAHQEIHGGSPYDGMAVKFSPSGSRIWGTYYGGSGQEDIMGLDVDSANNVFLVGYTSSTNNISTLGVYQPVIAGGPGEQDGFLVKLDPNCNRIWATYYGGTGSSGVDFATDIKLGINSTILICGSTRSTTGISTSYGFETNHFDNGASEDAYLSLFDSTGYLIWGTYYGGEANDWGYSCDYSTNPLEYYLAGVTFSTQNISTPGSHQEFASGGGREWFLVKFGACSIDSVELQVGTTAFCDGDSILLSASGALNYTWSNSNIGDNIYVTVGGTYYVIGNDGVCSDTSNSININMFPNPMSPVITSYNNAAGICQGDSLLLMGNPSNGILWSTGSTNDSVMIDLAGSYTLSFVDSNGCTSENVINIESYTNPVINILGDSIVCPLDSIVLVATGGNNFEWSTTELTSSIYVNPLIPSTYSVIGTDTNGCSGIAQLMVYPFYSIYSPPNCIDDSADVDVSSSISIQLLINDSNVTQFAIISGPNNGTVNIYLDSIVYSPNNGFTGNDTIYYVCCSQICSNVCDTGIIILSVTRDIIFIIPEIITPNGDGYNDTFFINGLDQFPNNELFIMNRWGDLLFQAKPYLNDWAGQHNTGPVIIGDRATDGTYYYLLRLNSGDSPIKGFIELIKN